MSSVYTITTAQGTITARHFIHCTAPHQEVGEKDLLEAVNNKRVLIHFHGGLVDRASAGQIAARLGGCGDGERYPVARADVQLYVIWQSGVMDAFKGLLADSVFGMVAQTVMGFFQPAMATTAASRWRNLAAPTDDASLQSYYTRELPEVLTSEDLEKNNLLLTAEDEPGERSLTAATLVTIAVEATKAILARRKKNPPHCKFEAMVREEVLNASKLGLVGVGLWNQMKLDAAAHARDGFLVFFKKMYAASSELTLVGHSAGAILITELINAMDSPAPDHAKKMSVVFLAPAITLQRFNECQAAITDYLELPVRVYAMASNVEANDNSITWRGINVYLGSLLQLVNFVFEAQRPGKLLGLEYYASKQKFGSVLTFETSHDCTTHGGFDDNRGILDLI